MHPAALRRYTQNISPCPLTGCWWWTGPVNHGGYGHLRPGGKTTIVTHIALHLDGRPRPVGLLALHSCDQPLCVNPRHLRWGTRLDNTRDAQARGRFNNKGGAKLSVDDVREIKRTPRSVEAQVLADRFGVERQAIYRIRYGQRWGDVHV